MNRRESIIRLATLMGGTVLGPRLLQGAWHAEEPGGAVSAPTADVALLDEIGDTIIPRTDVPGAKAVGIGAFITMMMRECYEPVQQTAFQSGVDELAKRFRAQQGRAFVGAPAEMRTIFLNELDREQRTYTKGKTKGQPDHWFRGVKELTIIGYFSSEIGCTQAIRFIEVPGSFDGNVPYKKGDRVWFS